jgi:hypothetical protein
VSGTSLPPPGGTPGPEPTQRSGAPTAIGWGVALIAIGLVWILSLAGVTIRWEWVLPVALIGIGLVVLTVGRRGIGDGLIGFGVVVAVIALLVPIGRTGPPLSAGEQDHRPATIAEVEPEYALGAGSLTIDLRDLVATDETVVVRVRLGMGQLVVRVPADAAVSGEARVAVGEVRTFDRASGGVAPSQDLKIDGDGMDIDLDLQVGLGRIEVTS